MILNPSNPEDRVRFYQIGKSVRESYDTSMASLWRDSENLEQIVSIEEKQLKIFGKEGGRIGVFRLSENLGAIGWYECLDNPDLANELLSWAVDQLRALGAKNVVGPVNGSVWYNYRFNLSSSKPMFAGEPYQPHYYVKQWEQFGFEIGERYETNVSGLQPDRYPSFEELRDELEEKGLMLKVFTAEINHKYIQGFYELVTASFNHNKIYSAISWEEYVKVSADYPKVLDQQHSFVAFDGDKPIAFVGCILDLLKPYYVKSRPGESIYTQPKLIIKTLVVHPDWQLKGIGALLVKASMRSAIDDGIYNVVHALMHEDNLSAVGGKRMFATSSKSKYALFKLKLDED